MFKIMKTIFKLMIGFIIAYVMCMIVIGIPVGLVFGIVNAIFGTHIDYINVAALVGLLVCVVLYGGHVLMPLINQKLEEVNKELKEKENDK